MGLGVLGLTLVDQPWQLYLAFALMIPGWAAMGGGAINTHRSRNGSTGAAASPPAWR